MTIELTTGYIGATHIIILLCSVIYILELSMARRVLRKHNLEKEYDDVNSLFYVETALMLTAWTFLICHFIQVVMMQNSIWRHGMLGMILGIIGGFAVMFWIDKKVWKKEKRDEE